jgi:ligand-binding sensor domain-containing protein
VRHWRIEHGLPLDRLTSLAQNPDGYLWIGTDDQGLSRFDGRNFVNLNPLSERGLPGWRISQLLVDANGRLWVGLIAARQSGKTAVYGVCRMKPVAR